jgi:hypothetical protein
MKHLFLTIAFLLLSGAVQACIMSPFKRTAMYSEKVLEQSDVMFFGRLDAEEFDEKTNTQRATFTVIKSYKGNLSGQVVVLNKLSSSCSRAFKVPHSAFYVYAERVNDSNTYSMPRSATFIPLGNAIDYDWSPE